MLVSVSLPMCTLTASHICSDARFPAHARIHTDTDTHTDTHTRTRAHTRTHTHTSLGSLCHAPLHQGGLHVAAQHNLQAGQLKTGDPENGRPDVLVLVVRADQAVGCACEGGKEGRG